jgi:hypothetical protein
MNRDRGDLVPQVVSWFRRGFDTATISDVLEIRESAIERALHAGLDIARRSREMERQERHDEENQDEDKGPGEDKN